VAAVQKPLEPHKMRWQRCDNIFLSLDRYHGIFFAA
jgi:hypothetical protein